MKNISISKRNRTEGMSSMWAAGSRVALLVTAIVVAVMPLTEYFWHFDKFLRGGQDFELSLLSVATIVCLVMILLQNGKRSVSLLLSLRKWLCKVFHIEDPAPPWIIHGTDCSSTRHSGSESTLGQYILALQV